MTDFDPGIERKPNEDWKDFVTRLEAARLRARAAGKEVEAEALREIAETEDGVSTQAADGSGEHVEATKTELEVIAEAKKRAAEEFRRAVRTLDENKGGT